MEWQVILGIVLAAPAILIPVALLWYINVSGVNQVFRATRARERKRAEAVKGHPEEGVAIRPPSFSA